MLRRRRWVCIGQRMALVWVLCTGLFGCGVPDVTRSDYDDPEGRIAFVGGGAFGNFEIFVMRPNGGGATPVVAIDQNPRSDYSGPSWSPDGGRLAFASNMGGNANFDIYVMSLEGTGLQRIVDYLGADFAPAWSPDGQRIAFQSIRKVENGWDIFVVRLDGTGLQNLTDSPGNDELPAWSPDGTRIAYQRISPGRGSDIYVIQSDGSNPVRLTEDGHVNGAPAWSPDGLKIAFESTRHQPPVSALPPGTSAEYEIYTLQVDGTGIQRITFEADTVHAVRFPTWSPDGQRIAAEYVEIVEERVAIIYGIVVMAADGSNLKHLNIGRGARFPRWSPR